MTPDERQAAGAVMASDGPWDFRARTIPVSDTWIECQGEPEWNWRDREYRVRPPQPQYCWLNVYRSSDGKYWHNSYDRLESANSPDAANTRVGLIKVHLEERFDK